MSRWSYWLLVSCSLLCPAAAAVEAELDSPGTAILDSDYEFDGGSGIALGSLSERQVEDLAVLGRVWGFLKYHHPGVTGGKWHWDYELMRLMPAVLDAEDARQRKRILADWLARLGFPDGCDPCAPPPENAYLVPRLDWLADTELLGPELSRQLQQVHRYRSTDEPQLYVSVPYKPKFDNELAYPDMDLPDAGFRILALFRFWNAVEYWFPYRDQIDHDWVGVLHEFLPRLVGANDREIYRLELLALIAKIQDSHGDLWPPTGVRPPQGECFWPVHLDRIEGRFVVTAIGDGWRDGSAVLQVGDVVYAIDGRAIASLVESWSPYYPASNDAFFYHSIALKMSRGECENARVRIGRSGDVLTLSVPRTKEIDPKAIEHDRAGNTFQFLSPEVAYIKLSDVRASGIGQYLQEASDTRGLVIDIRNYPSDYVVFALGNHLVREPTTFVRYTKADLFNPGTFTWFSMPQVTPTGTPYEEKVAILVDEASLSQSEYTAMALRASPRSVVVGSTTAGADGPNAVVPLPGGLYASFSGMGIFNPDKSPTQRVGIVPDIVARPTLEGIREGRDEVLEAALRYILGENVDEAAIREMASRP
jgi:C-terminal processing protease CtpA/Prc